MVPPNNRLQRTALRAAAEPERYTYSHHSLDSCHAHI
jgi:hypothetical protein